jgi:hypothetical protein
MFLYAVICLTVAALFGLYMAVGHFKGRTPPPAAAAVLHGLFAVLGVVLLLLGVLEIGWGTVHSWALILFVAAALGGLYLVSHHLRGVPLPSPVVVIHALVAVVAFLILVSAVFLIG